MTTMTQNEIQGHANRTMPNTGGWQDRHDKAWGAVLVPNVHSFPPRSEKQAHEYIERAIVTGLKAWQAMAAAHEAANDAPIGEDYFLGPAWLQIGKGLRAMLNGYTGALDCGTLDSFILDTVAAAGFDPNDL
jgi:hypothetical protein